MIRFSNIRSRANGVGVLTFLLCVCLVGCQSASKRVAKSVSTTTEKPAELELPKLVETELVKKCEQSVEEIDSVAQLIASDSKSDPTVGDKSVSQVSAYERLMPGLTLEQSKTSKPKAAEESVLAEPLSIAESNADSKSFESNANESSESIVIDSSQEEAIPAGPIDSTQLKLNAQSSEVPTLTLVVESVRQHFPMIREAEANRTIASGEALSASGAYDRVVEGYSNGQPQDFYENNWHKWSVKRNTMWGGKVGAGYRIGRGSFEPWYKERETNDGGEFSISLSAPIGRDREIDEYRAELWRAQLERGRVEPFIRAQVIMAVRDGSIAYWKWVAANENLLIADEVLKLGTDRVDLLNKQIELGEKAKIDAVDNRRIIVSRLAKQTDARRKLQQAAIKLSLYLRTANGEPLPLNNETLLSSFADIKFPETSFPDAQFMQSDLAFAQANRPELSELNVLRQQVAVAYRQANNETRPDVDAGLFLGQDVGNPTSSDDKSEFEVEATLTVSVPLERRKARGKVRQLSGKLAQLRAKTQFASEKIATEVDTARAALVAANERVAQTTEGLGLAKQIQKAELRLYAEGQSTLFNLNLREKQTAEAAGERVNALLDFYLAEAEYRAALGLDTLDF